MQDFDLEELESRLYGQVFHSAPEQQEQVIPEPAIPSTVSIPIPEPAAEVPRQVRQVSNYSVSNTLPNKNRYWNSKESSINQIRVIINNEVIPPLSTSLTDNRESPNLQQQNAKLIHPTANQEKNRKRNRKKKNKKNKTLSLLPNNYGEIQVNSCLQCAYRPHCICGNKFNKFPTSNQDYVDPAFYYEERLFNNNIQLPNMAPNQYPPNECPVINPYFNNHQHFAPITHQPAPPIDRSNNIEIRETVVVISDSDEDSVVIVPLVEKPPDPVYVIESDSDISIVDSPKKAKAISIEENINDKLVDNETEDQIKEESLKNDSRSTDSNINVEKNNALISVNMPIKIDTSVEHTETKESPVGGIEFFCTPDSVKNNFMESDVNEGNSFHSNFNLDDSHSDLTKEEFLKPKLKPTNQPIISERDMLCTPDSSVNDFIDNDLNEDSQCGFNFDLHGSDLDLAGKEFVKPAKVCHPSDIYETDSSCSGHGTPTKGSAFNDLVTNTPVKDIFHEPDLASFSNFITPNRDNNKKRKQGEASLKQVKTKALGKLVKNKDDKILKMEDEHEEVKKPRKKDKRNIPEDILTPDVSQTPKNKLKSPKKIPLEILKKRESKIRKMKKHWEIELDNLNRTDYCKYLGMDKLKKIIRRKVKGLNKKLLKISSNKNSKGGNINLNQSKTTTNLQENGSEDYDYDSDESIELDLKTNKGNEPEGNEEIDVTIEDNKEIDVTIEDNSGNSNDEIDVGTEETQNEEEDIEINVLDDDENDQDIRINVTSTDEEIDVVDDYDYSDDIHVPGLDNIPNVKNDGSSNDIILNIPSAMSSSTSKDYNSPTSSTSASTSKHMVVNPFHDGKGKKSFKDFWTPDKEAFYDESWGQEDYDLNTVIQSMTSDVSKWKINDDDKPQFKSPNRRKYCLFCKQPGHYKYDCPKYNNQAIKCSMCGKIGHLRSRCPNLVCTTCGNRGGYHTTSCQKCAHYVKIRCSICKMMGHPDNICPDLWRRYHLTTKEHMLPSSCTQKLKPVRDQWCSGCAGRGHLYHECRRITREHFPTLPQIISYEPIYDKNLNLSAPEPDTSDPEIPYLDNVKLSSITNYKNSISNNNAQKYGNLIKSLIKRCQKGPNQFLSQLRYLDQNLRRNNFDTKKIATLYKLRNLIRRQEEVFL